MFQLRAVHPWESLTLHGSDDSSAVSRDGDSVLPRARSGTTVDSGTSGPRSAHGFNGDRQRNVILFGLQETESLFATKAIVDEIFESLAGRCVCISDLFRLGKRPSENVPDARPRPVLIELNSAWDRRLVLASKRELKERRESLELSVSSFMKIYQLSSSDRLVLVLGPLRLPTTVM